MLQRYQYREQHHQDQHGCASFELHPFRLLATNCIWKDFFLYAASYCVKDICWWHADYGLLLMASQFFGSCDRQIHLWTVAIKIVSKLLHFHRQHRHLSQLVQKSVPSPTVQVLTCQDKGQLVFFACHGKVPSCLSFGICWAENIPDLITQVLSVQLVRALDHLHQLRLNH